MCGSMADIQSATAENRREKKKIETTAAKYNGLPYRAAIMIIAQPTTPYTCQYSAAFDISGIFLNHRGQRPGPFVTSCTNEL